MILYNAQILILNYQAIIIMTKVYENLSFEDALKEDLSEYESNPYLVRMTMDMIKQMYQTDYTADDARSIKHRQQSDAMKMLQSRQVNYQQKNTIIEAEDQEDYENIDVDNAINDNIKRRVPIHQLEKQYKTIHSDVHKYQLIGTNSKGTPLFRMTDLYLPAGRETKKLFEERIRRELRIEKPQRTKNYTEQTYDRILDNWINRQNQEFYQRGQDEINQAELEDIAADIGQRKQNFFLYYKDFEQHSYKMHEQALVDNLYLKSDSFVNNFQKSVSRMKQQFENVEQFQSDEEIGSIQMDWRKQKNDKFALNKNGPPLWGEPKNARQTQQLSAKQRIFSVQDELQGSIQQSTLSSQIIKQYAYINSEVIDKAHTLPIQQLQRLEIDLNNSDYFSIKIHNGVMKRSEQIYKATGQKVTNVIEIIKEEKQKIRAQPSLVSHSSFTGNPTMISAKPISENAGYIKSQNVNQTIQNLISEKLRIQKKTAIRHSDVANKLVFTKFRLQPKQFQNFHRSNYTFGFHRDFFKVVPLKNKPAKNHPEFLELNTQKQESYIKFPNPKSLGLASGGDFIAVENIEESPLLISNIGMCSKLMLQVNSKNVLDAMQAENFDKTQFQDLEKERQREKGDNTANNQSLLELCASWRKVISDSLGNNGKIHIGDNESLLIGTPQGNGVAVLESNLSSVPIVKQKNNNRDFILIRQGQNWYIRRIQAIYTSGQVEPKMQVFSPDSRNINNYLLNYFKSYTKKIFSNNGHVTIDHLKEIFPAMNDHNMRRILKEMNSKSNDNRTFLPPDEKDFEFDVTPEQICQYEKMQNSLLNLQSTGITTLRTPDKMKQIVSAYFKKNPDDLRKFAIARTIHKELQLTSWYLTESFTNAEQGQAKMQLVGFGDPTNGHGGYSYIKKPQKERMEKDEQLIQKKQDKKVSGTAADLRKLKTYQITNMLKESGLNDDDLAGKKRWDRVDILKKIGNGQFLRVQRQTKKMKKQSEKKEISAIFNKMLRNLHGIEPEKLEDINLNENEYNTIEHYIKQQTAVWQKRRKRLQRIRQQTATQMDIENEKQENEQDDQ